MPDGVERDGSNCCPASIMPELSPVSGCVLALPQSSQGTSSKSIASSVRPDMQLGNQPGNQTIGPLTESFSSSCFHLSQRCRIGRTVNAVGCSRNQVRTGTIEALSVTTIIATTRSTYDDSVAFVQTELVLLGLSPPQSCPSGWQVTHRQPLTSHWIGGIAILSRVSRHNYVLLDGGHFRQLPHKPLG